MIQELLTIAKVLILAWGISRFEPISWMLELMTMKWDNLLTKTTSLLLMCSKCLALWIGLTLTHNIYMAIICCFIMVFYEKTIGKWEKRIEF